MQKVHTSRLSPEMTAAVQLRLSKMLMLEEVFEKVSVSAADAFSDAELDTSLSARDALRELFDGLPVAVAPQGFK